MIQWISKVCTINKNTLIVRKKSSFLISFIILWCFHDIFHWCQRFFLLLRILVLILWRIDFQIHNDDTNMTVTHGNWSICGIVHGYYPNFLTFVYHHNYWENCVDLLFFRSNRLWTLLMFLSLSNFKLNGVGFHKGFLTSIHKRYICFVSANAPPLNYDLTPTVTEATSTSSPSDSEPRPPISRVRDGDSVRGRVPFQNVTNITPVTTSEATCDYTEATGSEKKRKAVSTMVPIRPTYLALSRGFGSNKKVAAWQGSYLPTCPSFKASIHWMIQ